MADAKTGRFSYDYARPALTADVVLVTREAKPRVLLIERKHEPFAGRVGAAGRVRGRRRAAGRCRRAGTGRGNRA